jgi:hypothetical protein
MLKPLTLSVSLAVALGMSSVSMAGLHNKGCSTCGLASPQGPIASSQCAVPSAQSACGDVCANPCAKKCCLSGLFKHKPKTYCYEWVLKKKHCGGLFGHKGGCDTCGSPVYPSAQYASPQAYGSGQAYGTGQVYGAGQTSAAPAAPAGDEAPPPPTPTDGAAPPAGEPAPAPATPPAANAPQSSLLFLAPAGN